MYQAGKNPQSQNELVAREKLAEYVYEYLVHSGSTKAAEAFKTETQLNNQAIAAGEPPGFLHNWWCVFWDLYSALPERRDKFPPSAEAKYFYENFYPPMTYANQMMNGMHGPPQPWPPNADGAMLSGGPYHPFQPRGPPQTGPSAQSSQASPLPGYQSNAFSLGPRAYGPGPRSGAPTPSGMGASFVPGPAGGPPSMFPNDQQMRGMPVAVAQQQPPRMPPNQMRMPPAAQMRMRPTGFPPGQQPYFEDPSGTPPFPHGPMMPNGCPPGSLMPSPGMGGPPPPSQIGADGLPVHDQARFMLGSVGPQPPGGTFQAVGHPHSHHDGAGTPSSSGGGGGPTSVGPVGPSTGIQANTMSSDGAGQMGGTANPLQSLLNGEGDGMDVKQSPTASVHGAPNGGTPLGHGPSSVHSQSGGGPNSQQQHPSHHQQHTPTSEIAPMEFHQPLSATKQSNAAGGGGNNSGGPDEQSEILKIKASLTEDFGSYHHS